MPVRRPAPGDTGARTVPVQARGKETVERILDATARVLAERGYGGLTTNHVAAEAGISIGSLYRWFTDKHDLVESLRSRTNEQVLGEVSDAMVATVSLEAREGIALVLTRLVEQLRTHAGVVGALLREAPLGAHQNVLPEIEQRLAGYVRVFVHQHAPHLSAVERETRIHLAMGVTLGACMRAVFECPDDVDGDRMIELTIDLLTLGLAAA